LTTIYQRTHTHTFWPLPTASVNNHYRTPPLIFMSYSSYGEISLTRSMSAAEMTPSLSMVSTLSDLPSTLCGPE
ncbi:hypothetical protein T12_15554, partial [Trichinella patagoniensis]